MIATKSVVAASLYVAVLATAGMAHGAESAPLPGTVTPSLAENRPTGLLIRFVDRDRDGIAKASTETALTLVHFRQSPQAEGRAEESTTETVKTDRDGVLRLPQAGPRDLRALRFEEAGETVEVRLRGRGSMDVARYAAELTDDDVSLDVRINMSVRDSGCSTWIEYTFATTKPGVRKWTKKAPLILPILAPAVRDTVLDRGAIIPATKDVEVQSRDAVKVHRMAGGLALVGSVAPGRPATLRVHYAVKIASDSVDLGLRGVVGKTSFAIATIAVPPVRIRMDVNRPARVATYQEGRERFTGMSLVHPIGRGEVAVVRILDFPARAAWPGRMLGSAAVAMVIAAGAFGFGAWRGRS